MIHHLVHHGVHCAKKHPKAAVIGALAGGIVAGIGGIALAPMVLLGFVLTSVTADGMSEGEHSSSEDKRKSK